MSIRNAMNSSFYKLLVLPLLFFPLTGLAQELSPRIHWPAPVGTQVATIGYSYTSGDVIPDRSLPITGVDSKIHAMHFGYRKTLGFLGRTTNLIVEIPYIDGNTKGEHQEIGILQRNYQGAGDLGATLSINLIGAPAMTGQEFQKIRENPGSFLGASLKLVAPTGKYNPKRLINVGANRWAMKTELGYIASLNQRWLLEMSLGAWFFADNNDFLGVTKKQKPVVTVQGHLIHRFKPGFWMSLDVNYYEGGRSTIGKLSLNDLQRDSKIGMTLVFPFAGKHAIKLNLSKGSISDSQEDFTSFSLSHQQVF